jgi:hypothetical protein
LSTAKASDISADSAHVDVNGYNSGTNYWLNFGGTGSGEGIGSKRTSGAGQYGLDFFTYYGTQRLHIGVNGGITIGNDMSDRGAGNLLALGTLESLPPTGGYLGLLVNQTTGSGNYTGNGWSGNLNLINVSDTASLPGAFGVALGIQMSLNSSSVKGHRNVMQSILFFNHASDTVSNGNDATPNYTAGYFAVGVGAADSGTNTTTNSRGAFFGLNPDTVAYNGATNLQQLAGIEVDYEAQAGSSMRWKTGLIVNQKQNDAVQGTYDNAISICRDNTTYPVSTNRGAKVGIEFGYGDGGGDPIATNGTLIKATSNSNPTVATGIDFYDYNITGNLIQGRYSSLGDNGGLFIGAGSSYTSTNVIAQGGQSNIDIKIYPKGNGVIQVGNSGSFATGTHTTIAKWLKVKDDAGNVYYMPVYQ